MRTTVKVARVARRALSEPHLPAIAGCAFHQSTEANNGNRAPITAVEIDSVHALNAYDAVHRLRPQILAYRGPVSLDPRQPPATPNVYIDNMLYGDVSTLRNIVAAMMTRSNFTVPPKRSMPSAAAMRQAYRNHHEALGGG